MNNESQLITEKHTLKKATFGDSLTHVYESLGATWPMDSCVCAEAANIFIGFSPDKVCLVFTNKRLKNSVKVTEADKNSSISNTLSTEFKTLMKIHGVHDIYSDKARVVDTFFMFRHLLHEFLRKNNLDKAYVTIRRIR
jgi:hypothetical protein